MDLFKFAMQMERDGEAYYRQLAADCPLNGFSSICSLLAAEAVRRQGVLMGLQESYASYMPAGSLTPDVRSVFARLIERGKWPPYSLSTVELYRHAQDLERQGREFYLEHSDDVQSPALRDAFNLLADEELRHSQLLEDTIEFVSRPLPGHWLENAEWNHHEDY